MKRLANQGQDRTIRIRSDLRRKVKATQKIHRLKPKGTHEGARLMTKILRAPVEDYIELNYLETLIFVFASLIPSFSTNSTLSIVFPIIEVLNVLLVELILIFSHNAHLQQLVEHITRIHL